jgi:hypothetical protein
MCHLWHIIQEPTGNQRDPINGWKWPFNSSLMKNKRIGLLISRSHNLHTTIGHLIQLGRKSPFFLLMGFNPCADWVHTTSPIPRVTLHLEQLKEARDQAQGFMIKAQQSWVKHQDMPKYKEGDLVWLEGKNLHINQPTTKLAPRRHGPFKIVQVMSSVNHRLELPTQWSIHPVFHINLLTPYKETIMHGPNFT